MRLGPYWATYIWTSKLDIPDLVSTYDTHTLIRLLTQGRALFSQMTLITFIVEQPKLHSEWANQSRGFQKFNCF